jgi:anthranilate phosphoribosyltransferase
MSLDMTRLKALLAKLAEGATLSEDEAREGFEIMMTGNATPSQMGAFLMALRVRGESVAEITAGARTLRAKVLPVTAPPQAIDLVGTGGDAKGSFNVSTASAIVVAACGVPVAKHGNRAFSSRSGAADVLTALGVNIDLDPPAIERSIAEAGIGFMMAPRHHSAMRHVGGTRVELGTRTIFNLLGPLANPAGVRRQLVGAFDRKWIGPMATTLGQLGSLSAWVVHGEDGLDEITTTAATYVAELREGAVRDRVVKPEDAGVARARPDDLKGGSPEDNAAALRAMLGGQHGPIRDITLLNAGAALLIAGKVHEWRAGTTMAAEAIDSGAAKRVLERLIAVTRAAAP